MANDDPAAIDGTPQRGAVRTWRIADVLILLTLVFNLGVTVTRLRVLEEWRVDHERWANELKDKIEKRAEDLKDQVQAIRERIARMEEAEHQRQSAGGR